MIISFNRKIILFFITIILIIPVYGYSIHVSFYLGKVTLIRDGRRIKVSMNDVIKSGDIVKTGRGAQATLSYNDNSRITISSNTTARIGSKNIKGSDDIALISGNLTGKFAKISKGKRSRKVYGPTVVCAIRGTEFKMAVSKGGNSRVNLSEGKLHIKNPYGNVNLNSNQKVESGVAEKPRKKTDNKSMDQWKKEKDNDFKRNPEKNGNKYKKYISNFGSRNKNTNSDIDKLNKMIQNASKKKDLKNAGENIQNAEEKARDDMILNETANTSIEEVMNDYKSSRKDIYDLFYKIKRESNMVMEQQKKNYEAIQAVKDDYKKAYKKIIGDFEKDKKDIIGDIDFDNVKPKFDIK